MENNIQYTPDILHRLNRISINFFQDLTEIKLCLFQFFFTAVDHADTGVGQQAIDFHVGSIIRQQNLIEGEQYIGHWNLLRNHDEAVQIMEAQCQIVFFDFTHGDALQQVRGLIVFTCDQKEFCFVHFFCRFCILDAYFREQLPQG